MGIRVECDWCRQPIEAGTPYVAVEVDGKVEGRDVGGPARVYCGRRDGDRSCAGRLLALLDANPGGPVDMGMEWRLVRIGDEARPPRGRRRGARPRSITTPPASVQADADLNAFLGTLTAGSAGRTRHACARQGISTLEQLDALTDDELIEIAGVGSDTRAKIRQFIAARNAAREQVTT
jgi:hypothetical protein